MAPRKPKAPEKKKDKNIKNTSAAMDAFMAIGPHAQDIANYLAHGTAAGGLGALGYMGNKARKMMKKHDKELGRNRGGAVMKARGGTFKGTF
jgi:hypothetical protein